ncbi:acetyltransferase, GNAT family protein [unidentified eubacterium SCB49]|nr:acetyltransferase, GNAT family protein [unidentified eubacterium SCB49]
MKVIKATITNLDQLVPLFDNYRQFYNKPSDIEGAHSFLKARFNKNESTIFIALDENNNALGFTQLYPLFSSVTLKRDYLLNDLFVSEKARGNGVGKSLLLKAQDFATLNNAKGIMLETGFDNPAQHLYEKLGWKRDLEVYNYEWKV